MRLHKSLLFCLLLISGQAFAETLEEFNQRILEELKAKNPEAAELFIAGNQARDRNDFASAVANYTKVREKVPDFIHVTRRLCTSELYLGLYQEALAHCQEAASKESSAENLTALAQVLVSPPEGVPSSEDTRKAFDLANEAAQKNPSLVSAQMIRCQTALALESTRTLEDCAARLEAIAPDQFLTHFFLVFKYGNAGRFSRAFSALERARELGMPQEQYKSLKDTLTKNEPFTSIFWRYTSGPGLWMLGIWSLGLLLLLVTGLALNTAAMKAASTPPSESSGRAVGLSKKLRTAYQTVLWLCCAYYYLSIPLVLLSVVALALGIVLLFVAFGFIPIKLVALVGILMLGTLYALLKGIFIRPKEEEPGERLDVEKHPKLQKLLQEVADKVGTRVVDRVYLTPGTELAVLERGSLAQQLKGTQERCLVLGVGILDGFQLRPFQSVLAHEYGHFSNRDTAGGGFALAVRRSILFTAIGLAQGGNAHWFNPAWLFLRGFEQVFLRVSQGASRLQEVLADRWAAISYGSAAFETGFQHVIGQSVRFQFDTNAAIDEVLTPQNPKALKNLYQYSLSTAPSTEKVNEAIEAALNAEPHPFDSHPSPKQRLAWVKALNIAEEPSPQDEGQVWDLFASREEIEHCMTAQIRDNIRASTGKYVPENEEPKQETNEEPKPEPEQTT